MVFDAIITRSVTLFGFRTESSLFFMSRPSLGSHWILIGYPNKSSAGYKKNSDRIFRRKPNLILGIDGMFVYIMFCILSKYLIILPHRLFQKSYFFPRVWLKFPLSPLFFLHLLPLYSSFFLNKSSYFFENENVHP